MLPPLRAIRYHQTIEEFIEDLLADMLTPTSGFFEQLIHDDDDPNRESIELELENIRAA